MKKSIDIKPSVVFKTGTFPVASESFVLQNITETIKSGFDVSIITDHIASSDNAANQDTMESFGLMKRVSRLSISSNSVKRIITGYLYLLNPSNLVSSIRYILLSKSFTPKLGYFIAFYKKFRDKDVFHVHFSDNLEPLLSLKKIGLLKGRLIVTFHGYDAHNISDQGDFVKTIRDYEDYVHAITVNSEYLKNLLIQAGLPASLIHIIPMGIDTDIFPCVPKSKSNDGPFKLITVGRLIPLKGQEYGIRVVKDLREKGLEVQYTIVGYGSNLNRLKEISERLGVADRITFTGRKTQIELKELLGEQDAFLMTSVADPDTGRREAFGLVVVEAQAMGLPIVAFDSGGVKSAFQPGKSGYLVEEGAIEEMSEKVIALMNDEDEYNRFSENAAQLAIKKYNLNDINKKFEELYKSNHKSESQ